ncbi:unnamed protein product, partial [Ectocarpus fasciculatus]
GRVPVRGHHGVVRDGVRLHAGLLHLPPDLPRLRRAAVLAQRGHEGGVGHHVGGGNNAATSSLLPPGGGLTRRQALQLPKHLHALPPLPRHPESPHRGPVRANRRL